jgi:hypothetical protein
MEDNTTKNTENENLAKAKSEIEEIVKKYNISLIPVVMHHGDKTFSRIDIAPASENISDSTSEATLS